MKADKRMRPTWAQVRELEKQVKDQTEALHERCTEADGWRDKFRALKEETDGLRVVEQRLAVRTKELLDLRTEARGWQEKFEALKEQFEALKDERSAMTEGLKAENERLKQRVHELIGEAGEDAGKRAMAEEAMEKMRGQILEITEAYRKTEEELKGQNAKLARKMEANEAMISLLRQENDRMGTRLYEMQNRGLLARIFNR